MCCIFDKDVWPSLACKTSRDSELQAAELLQGTVAKLVIGLKSLETATVWLDVVSLEEGSRV